jgi:hypothetical protein
LVWFPVQLLAPCVPQGPRESIGYDRAMKPLTPILQNVPEWTALMAEHAAALGVLVADALAVLATYDAWLAAGGVDSYQPMGLEGIEVDRTYPNHDTGREKTVTDYYEREPAEVVKIIAEHVMGWLRQKMAPAVGPAKPKRYRRTAVQHGSIILMG